MKLATKYILSFAVVLIFLTSGVFAQAIDNITRRCKAPNNSVFGKVLVTAIGDITYTPCPSRASIFTGIVDLSGATVIGGGNVSGTGTANFVPRWTGASTLANTPLSWNGTSYVFQNTAANAQFIIDLTPSVAGGRFRVGDFTTTPTDYLDIDQTAGTATLAASNSVRLDSEADIQIGDVAGAGNLTKIIVSDGAETISLDSRAGISSLGDLNGVGNGTNLRVNDNAQQFIFNGTTATVAFNDVINFAFFRVITGAGTTGNQVIDRPAGTVNFAAAATSLTVTNSTVNASSIILAIARTNDTTCAVKNVVAGAGSFVINMTAACTAETSVGFLVTN